MTCNTLALSKRLFKIDRSFKIVRGKQHQIFNKTITFCKSATINELRAFALELCQK